jgi:predicted Zn-dependent protease
MNRPTNPAPTDAAPIFEDRSRRFLIVVAVLMAISVAGYFSASPAYRQVKVWRARRLVTEGNAALATNNLPAVSRAVRSAMALAPSDARVQRLAAYYCARTHQAEGVSLFELLLKSGEATEADRQEFARFAQNLERLDLSGQLLHELIAENPQSRTNQLLVLDQLARLGDWPRVVTGAEAMAREFPGDPEISLMLARAHLGTGQPAAAPKALALLRGLLATTSDYQLAAARTLLGMPGPAAADLQESARLLNGQRPVPIADRLLIAEYRERLDPAHRSAAAESLVAEGTETLPPDEKVMLIEWLRSRRHFDLAMRLVPSEQARNHPGLLLARGELLADLRRWPDLDALVKQPNLPLHRVGVDCLRAVLAFGTGKADEAAFLLRDAAKAATGNPVFLQQVAVFAQQMGQPALAAEIWDGLLRNPATTIPAAAVLLRQARGSEDLEVERKVYKQLIGPLGQQPSVRFQHAYLSALFNEQLTDAESTLAGLLAQEMTSLPLRAALALAKLRLGKPAEALTLCETGDADWSAQEPRWRAIYAATLHANGQGAAARRIASRIPVDRLKLPERVLIEAIQGR